MYCGYLELCEDAEGLFWRTRVEVANDPGAIGGVEERRIECREEKGKRFLVLRPMKEVVREVSLGFCEMGLAPLNAFC